MANGLKIQCKHKIELTRGALIELINDALTMNAEAAGVAPELIPENAGVTIECSEAGRDELTNNNPLWIEW